MRRLLVVLLLALASTAVAQQWSVAVRYETPTSVTANATVELPAIDLLGFRAGPSVTVRGGYAPSGWAGTAQGGLTFAFVPRDPRLIGFLLETYYAVTVSDARPMAHAFGVVFVIAGRLR